MLSINHVHFSYKIKDTLFNCLYQKDNSTETKVIDDDYDEKYHI